MFFTKRVFSLLIVVVCASLFIMACLPRLVKTSAVSSENHDNGAISVVKLAPKYSEDQFLPKDTVVDRLVVYKSQRMMLAYAGRVLLKNYVIALGDNPIGHKQFEGDERTPEGRYLINDRNPNSGYHKNLGVSYPNAQDTAYATAQGKSAGGDIKIHGLPNGQGYVGKAHRLKDWTNGCIAVTNEEVDELYRVVKPNALIEILP